MEGNQRVGRFKDKMRKGGKRSKHGRERVKKSENVSKRGGFNGCK